MSTRLIPPTSELTEPYWAAARSGELKIQQCQSCGARPFPPRKHCPECGRAALDWQKVSGRGTVYSFTVSHRPPHPVFADQCPMAIAVIELDEGPRMMSNIVDCAPSEIAVGMPVEVRFEPIDDADIVLPVFAPV